SVERLAQLAVKALAIAELRRRKVEPGGRPLRRICLGSHGLTVTSSAAQEDASDGRSSDRSSRYCPCDRSARAIGLSHVRDRSHPSASDRARSAWPPGLGGGRW